MTLQKLRDEIDSLDVKILALLNTRAKTIISIGKLKAKTKRSVYAPDREADVYRKLAENNKGPLSNDSVKAIYREIMSGALNLEKPLSIAYFGPEFTFTHLASMKKFGASVNYKGCETIKDVFVEVGRGRADYGVVPIENSIEGAVNHTLDMFMDSDVLICSEIYLEISHNLLSRTNDAGKIRKVYSHPQVFGQCRIWLETNMPRAKLIEASSTAHAAAIASKEHGAACIATSPAAEKYNLNVLYTSIEDSSRNVTRFLVIGDTEAKPTGRDKTSVIISLKDKVGALHDMLVPFKDNKINLTKIESRPSKARAWEYCFYVDMEGHYRDARIKKALDRIRTEAAFFKVLGSYPAGDSV